MADLLLFIIDFLEVIVLIFDFVPRDRKALNPQRHNTVTPAEGYFLP